MPPVSSGTRLADDALRLISPAPRSLFLVWLSGRSASEPCLDESLDFFFGQNVKYEDALLTVQDANRIYTT
ncbi:hypothetical protein CC80DRAFT_274012 [Byssothecium circinans]|uniref:Uncharacterized protein n=1 Tax=Byssothecium circinans TaxID=147558 RepID=A0A6A5TF26_9PLEO|nr:hypothetical protein CC80DRAFT_274012 [Byssothecium circinans]